MGSLFEEAEMRLSFGNIGVASAYAELPQDVAIAMYHAELMEQRRREDEIARERRRLPGGAG